MNAPCAPSSEALGVLIADSSSMQSQLLINALRRHSEFKVRACPFDTGSIARAIADKLPDITLLSVHPPANIPETMMTFRRFHVSYPQIPKVLLVDTYNRELVIGAFRSGARGIFSISDSNLRLLCKCLQRVASGQIWANTEQLNYLMDSVSEVPSLRVLDSTGNDLLTPREEQVVALVAEGLGNREIATELNLSEHTIKKHLFRIFEKLGISTRVELVLYAVNHGDSRQAEWLAGTSLVPPQA